MSNKTYAEITANLQSWLEDDDSEFAGSIDDIINLGEMRLWRDLDLALFSSTDTVSTAVNTGFVTKPSTDAEMVAFDHIYYDDGNKRTFLELRSSDYVRDMQSPNKLGSPRYYAEENETTWLIAPTPDGAYVLNCRGTTRPTQLSAMQTTTWLSLHQDDILFYACLAESEMFLKGDDRIAVWKQEYLERLPLAKKETANLMQSRYQLTPLHVPGVPTTQR